MCQYRVRKFRCGHNYKTPIPPCNLHRTCTLEQAALVELKTDMTDLRNLIRMDNLNSRDCPAYQQLLDRFRTHYRSYFGHGSTNGNSVMASLRDVERYLDEEIAAIARSVTESIQSREMCWDDCWEGLLILGREAQLRVRRD